MTNRPMNSIPPEESEEGTQTHKTASYSPSSGEDQNQASDAFSPETHPSPKEISQSLTKADQDAEYPSCPDDSPSLSPESRSIDEAWAAILKDLSDIPVESGLQLSGEKPASSPADPFHFSNDENGTPEFSRFSSVSGPRDWVAPEDDELDDSISYDDIEDFIALAQPSDSAPHHRLAIPVWIAAGCLILYAVLAAFALVPGSNFASFLCAAMGFSLAALAGFLSSPRAEDTDPFDDGARF